MGPVPHDGTVDQLLDFLKTLISEATRFAPVVPTPYTLPEVDEISLMGDLSDCASDNRDMESADSLSFEMPEENTGIEPL